jgi:hypothetical protein
VRLRSSASAYLSWTPSTTATSTQKLTYSAWIKRGTLGTGQQHFGLNGAITGSTRDVIRFSNDALNVYFNEASSAYVVPTMLFRDVSAWYHIVVAVDTTQATASNRILIYVNGVQVTSFSSATYPSQNYNFTGWLVSGKAQNLGRSPEPGYYTDGYMAETYVIDGQQLLPTSFGAFDAITGVWNPIQYTGTYGNNGFYLNFKDNTSTTTLGYDYSGNSRHWTANNISLTAGTTYDSMVDTPNNYGTDTGVGGLVRGNYCTFNPLAKGPNFPAPTNGNLQTGDTTAGNYHQSIGSTAAVSSGKWYWEIALNGTSYNSRSIGIAFASELATAGDNAMWSSASALKNYRAIELLTSTTVRPCESIAGTITTASTITLPSTLTGSSVFMVAMDIGAGAIWFGLDGTWLKSATTAEIIAGTTTNAVYADISAPTQPWTPAVYNYLNASSGYGWIGKFGQTAFSYTAPTGFKALCTQNLPTPTIDNGANHMAATLYTGTGASQNISNAVNGISFQPDLVWVKNRSSGSTSHTLYNTNVGIGTFLQSNTTDSSFGNAGISPILSNGFTAFSTNSWNNASGENYIAWQWKASSSNVTNTNGSVTSTVRANTTAGFSIATFTMPSSGGNPTFFTWGHGLNIAPSMIFYKTTSVTSSWTVYHSSIGSASAVFLNSTGGVSTSSGYFNNTSPTSTVATVNIFAISGNSDSVLAYSFAKIAGYSDFGSYTGNGSTDGPFAYCGFRPRYVLIKRTDSTGSWYIWDTARNAYNQMTLAIYPNLADAEPGGDDIDFLSNGFKMRDTFSYLNASGGTYIYAAFAENPFTISRAR